MCFFFTTLFRLLGVKNTTPGVLGGGGFLQRRSGRDSRPTCKLGNERRIEKQVIVFFFLPQGKRKKRKREKLQDSNAGKRSLGRGVSPPR